MNDVLNWSIDDLDMSIRTWFCLKHAGIFTVGQLCEQTPKELMRIRLMTDKKLEEIENKLKEYGVALKYGENEIK